MPKHGYDAEDLARMEMTRVRLSHERDLLAMKLVQLASRFPDDRARQYANEGVGRRLRTIDRSVTNIFQLYPPDRTGHLSMEECDDVAIQLQAFAINVYALFDNVAWVCVLLSKVQLSPMKIGPFKAETTPHFPPSLAAFLSENRVRTWHQVYGKAYRDATAHRLPIYLPSRAYTQEEGARWTELDTALMNAVRHMGEPGTAEEIDARLERHHALQSERDNLGSNSLLMALTLNGPDAEKPVFLHPQVLADYGLVQELVVEVISSVPSHFRL